MRTLIRAGALTAGVSAMLFLAPAAHALSLATPHGDNGTVKIHDASTGEELPQNEPHVCTFYLDAFGFDAVQEVEWRIDAWAPTVGGMVKSGRITLDDKGHGRTEDLSLPDGHYKLFWEFEGENGAAKHKVFWTDCEDSATSTPSEGTGTTPSPSPSSSSSPSPSSEVTDGATPSPGSSEAGSGVDPSALASPSGEGGTDDLAETGSSTPAGLLSAAALALVGAGGYLMLRRRKAAGN